MIRVYRKQPFTTMFLFMKAEEKCSLNIKRDTWAGVSTTGFPIIMVEERRTGRTLYGFLIFL